MSEIDEYKVTCDFCNKIKPFSEIKQVSLKIIKQNRHQNLLATMCKNCEEHGVKKTVSGQYIKENYKFKDEKSIFDTNEENQ